MTITPAELSELIDRPERRRAVSAIELTDAFLERIDRSQPLLNAFITVMAEVALRDAARVDVARGEGRTTPLDGLPIAVKDNVDVKGVRTTVGSVQFKDRIAAQDARSIARLRRAGGIVLGKTLLHELVFGVSCDNPWFGTARNPWDRTRIPGGSSGGSGAAVAADLCIAAVGSDTGGSIRIPAALTGVTGLRPTLGAIATHGAFPVAPSFDTVGPMARSVIDVERMFLVMAGSGNGRRRVDDSSPSPMARGDAPLRIGIPTNFLEGLDPGVERCLADVAEEFRGLGARVAEINIPTSLKDVHATCSSLLNTEALTAHRDAYERHPEFFGADIRQRLALAQATGETGLAVVRERAKAWRATVEEVFETVDLLLTPTTSRVAPPIEGIDTLEASRELGRLTAPWSLAQVPALSMPCGLADPGLPVGAQLVAPAWHESRLFGAARAYQAATSWHRRRPKEVFLGTSGEQPPVRAATESPPPDVSVR